jgi:glycerol uptake facilitator-like aquaporin
MVKDYVLAASGFFNDLVNFVTPGLILSFAAGCVESRKYFGIYVKEFIGSILMICFTFSAGKWIGQDSIALAWSFHAVGVIAADYFGGGQQVNPAVTMSMWALGKCSYTEAFVRVAGQMGGGLISFPLFHAISEALNWTPFGGPEYNMEANADAAISEFLSSFLLMWAIYVVSIAVFVC